jgi:hypothetical protein
MILASLVGIFAIPPHYVLFQGMRERLKVSARPRKTPAFDMVTKGDSPLPTLAPARDTKGAAADEGPTRRGAL